MDPENEGAIVETETVDATVLTEGGEPSAVLVQLPEGESEPVELPASDAVEIARIEADKEITIAAIQADTTVAIVETETELANARIEAEQEREETWQSQVEELRTNIAALETRITDLSTALAAPSTPIAPQELDLVLVAEPEAETVESSTPVSMSVPMLETQTEAILKDVAESPAETVALAKRIKRRLI